jgi:hypothetical protein
MRAAARSYGASRRLAIQRRRRRSIAASNPQAPNATATFSATLDSANGVAQLAPTFADNASATNGVTGARVTLGLTDPDSNAWVAHNASRFANQYALDSQGDQQLIFAAGPPGSSPRLTQLPLSRADGQSAGVDDVRFAPGHSLLVVDSAATVVYRSTVTSQEVRRMGRWTPSVRAATPMRSTP